MLSIIKHALYDMLDNDCIKISQDNIKLLEGLIHGIPDDRPKLIRRAGQDFRLSHTDRLNNLISFELREVHKNINSNNASATKQHLIILRNHMIEYLSYTI